MPAQPFNRQGSRPAAAAGHLRILMAALALTSTGCVHFTPEELRLADSATAFRSRSLDGPELHAFLSQHGRPAPGDGAWSFETLALAAYFFHPGLDVARAEYERTRAAEMTATARPNPTFSFSPGRNTSVTSPSPWIAGLNVELPIETAGKRDLRRSIARYESEAARLRLTDAAWKVRSTLREAVLEFRDATERHRVITRQAATQREVAALLQQKIEAGAIAAWELSAPRLAALRFERERRDAEMRLARSRPRLAAALGVTENALPASFALAVETRAAGTESPESDSVRDRALTGRADLLAGLAEYAAAEATLQLEVARQFPDLRFGPGYEYDQREHKWSLGMSIELPVFHRNQGPIAQAEARRREAAARVLALQAAITGEIEEAVAHARGAQQLVAAAGVMVAEQQKQRERAGASVAAGAGEQLDVLSAETELASAELLQWDATMSSAVALARVESAMQRPLDFDFSSSPRPLRP